jgi:hypothetical protein
LIPQISIQTQRGIIGIESERGQYDIRRPLPTIQTESTPTVITVDNSPGTLRIDHTLTDNALTGGKSEEFWLRIYSQYKEVALQNLNHIVEKGNRMGDLRIRGNPYAEMALDEFVEGAPDLQVYGHASPANISFEYIPNDPNVQVQQGELKVDVQVHRPEINFHRGHVRVYMEQYPSITITPPVIDMTA